MFSNGLDRKQAFKDDKNTNKMGISRELTHGFGKKNQTFFFFVFKER